MIKIVMLFLCLLMLIIFVVGGLFNIYTGHDKVFWLIISLVDSLGIGILLAFLKDFIQIRRNK